jgi:hypothetical protein
MNLVSDATIVAFFLEQLRKPSVIEESFEGIEGHLRSQGLEALVGQTIDAALAS